MTFSQNTVLLGLYPESETEKNGPKKAPLLFCPKEHVNPWASKSTGVTYYVWPDLTFWRNTTTRRNLPWFNTRNLRKPGQKFLLLEIGYTPITPVDCARYYWSSYNVFPHMNKANVAHFDGHVDSYREIMPYFFPVHNSIVEDHAITKATSSIARERWLYSY